MTSKRMLLVISREYQGRLYVDGHEIVRDGLDFKLVPQTSDIFQVE
jgi:hypothetical protein